MEPYKSNIDAAQSGQLCCSSAKTSSSSAASNVHKTGEVNVVAKCKPARFYPVDRQEEGLETLRCLADTKGNKAKRGAREKQRDGAKRLVQVQTRRALNDAGNLLKNPCNIRMVTNYGTEIPVMRTPAHGLLETVHEQVAEKMSHQKADWEYVQEVLLHGL